MILKRSFILCILINTARISSYICTAQSASDAFILARNWYSEGNFDQAIVEAKRAVFFDDSLKIPGYLILSGCYEQMELYDEAIKYLSLAAGLEHNDSLHNELTFQKINLYLRSNQPAYAFIELSGLEDKRSVYFSKKKDFYLALAYFQISDFNNSKKYSYLLLKESSGYDSCFINTLFLKAYRNLGKSPLMPAVSSAILPGSGQLMKGYYRDAANSFLLNAVLASVTYYSFIRLNPLDAIITMFPFVHRYYLSNIFNARDLAISKQENVNIELYNELLDYIDQILNDKDNISGTSGIEKNMH